MTARPFGPAPTKKKAPLTDKSSSQRLEKLIFSIVNFANGLEAAAVALRQNLEELGPQEKRATWNSSKIKWKEAQGFKGPYERSEDVNNPEFKAMLADLKSHNGRMTRQGYFYWVFRDAATVGRKKRSQKQ